MKVRNPFTAILARRRETRRLRERLRTLRESLIYISDVYFTTPTVPKNAPLNETQKINRACHEDIALAFQQNDLEAMEAYETYFSAVDGVRLVAICVDTIRLHGETLTNSLIESHLAKAHEINQRREVHGGHYEYGVPEERGGAAVLLSFILSHPEHEKAILQFVEQRGIPAKDDAAALMQQFLTLPVLSEGVL